MGFPYCLVVFRGSSYSCVPWLSDGPLEGPCVPLACWACCGLQASGLAWFLLCLPHLFVWCSALEGLSHSEVVSIAWDPHPQEPLRECSGLRACSSWQPSWSTLELRGKRGLDSGAESIVEISCLGRDTEVVEVFSSQRGPDSPLSHCLSLRWFRSHVVVLGVGPQLGQAMVLRAFVCFYGSSISLFHGGEAGARLTISSNPSGSSDLWVAVQTSGSLAEVWEVGSLQLVSELGSIEIGVRLPCKIRVRAAVGCNCCCVACMASVVAWCVHAVMVRLALDSLEVAFLVWRTVAGKSRCGAPGRLRRIWVCVPLWLREPACGVAFIGTKLLSVEPIEVSLPCWLFPCCWGVYCVGCVCGLLSVHCCALCSAWSALLLGLSRYSVCRVASLVERCNTCLWLLSGWCWLVVSSGEVLPESFSVGSGGSESFSQDCSVLVSAVVVLPQGLSGFSQNYALVVLVEVLPGPACVVSAVLLAAVFSLMVRVVWSFGLCILVKVLPRIALCRFWRRFFLGVLCVRFGPPLCCPCGSKCAIWLGCVLVRFS
ncbi:hypothetical protein Taro_052733 [Colocasia esculenta]|uniref:Uncharacterized protein n=1 Tax=Colocasia esculenta TaxID=4460 RepID=A0A843XKL1_COLES|nr:hypothetical protein [Colocasia esculenta]